jgi:hypothetical protein
VACSLLRLQISPPSISYNPCNQQSNASVTTLTTQLWSLLASLRVELLVDRCGEQCEASCFLQHVLKESEVIDRYLSSFAEPALRNFDFVRLVWERDMCEW